jgi:hypothetical protein
LVLVRHELGENRTASGGGFPFVLDHGAETAVVEVGMRRGLASVLFLEPLHNPKPKVVFMDKIN